MLQIELVEDGRIQKVGEQRRFHRVRIIQKLLQQFLRLFAGLGGAQPAELCKRVLQIGLGNRQAGVFLALFKLLKPLFKPFCKYFPAFAIL